MAAFTYMLIRFFHNMAFDKSKLNHSLDHVPVAIQGQIQAALKLIEAEFADQLAMVWLFGSYARGDFINDKRVNDEGMLTEYQSDIDILLILNTPLEKGRTNQNDRILKKLSNQVKTFAVTLHEAFSGSSSPSFHLIHESLERFNDALNHSEYFYLDVVNEGVVLLDRDTDMAQPQQMSAEKRREYGIRYFETLFEQITEFQQSFEFHYQRQHKGLAMFTLHQLCEHLFKVYLLVKTHYKPRTHRLWDLRKTVRTLDSEIVNLFPYENEADKKQFAFLCDAYVDSRYKTEYKVDPFVLDVLANKAQAFQHWVYQQCLITIDEFVKDQPYAKDYQLQHPLLDMDTLKETPLPEDVIKKQEVLLEEERIGREREAREKEKAQANEARALDQLEAERLEKDKEKQEKERLLKKLRDAGLE